MCAHIKYVNLSALSPATFTFGREWNSFYCVPMHKENMCTHYEYFLIKKFKPSTVFVRIYKEAVRTAQ